MSTTLQNLYDVFGQYTRENLDFCACCHYAEDIEKLKSSNLRNLGKDDLEVYFNNVLTIGDTNTYKYFLPRIFEVFANDFDLLSLWKSGPRFYDSEYILALFSFSKLLKPWKKDTIFLKQNIDYWGNRIKLFQTLLE